MGHSSIGIKLQSPLVLGLLDAVGQVDLSRLAPVRPDAPRAAWRAAITQTTIIITLYRVAHLLAD